MIETGGILYEQVDDDCDTEVELEQLFSHNCPKMCLYVEGKRICYILNFEIEISSFVCFSFCVNSV